MSENQCRSWAKACRTQLFRRHRRDRTIQLRRALFTARRAAGSALFRLSKPVPRELRSAFSARSAVSDRQDAPRSLRRSHSPIRRCDLQLIAQASSGCASRVTKATREDRRVTANFRSIFTSCELARHRVDSKSSSALGNPLPSFDVLRANAAEVFGPAWP